MQHTESRHAWEIISCRMSLSSICAVGCLLGACGANMNDLTTSSVAGYQPASLFAPTGYKVSANSDGSLRVSAAGPPNTPASRLEKIALARAAEYGNEQHLKTFTASAPETTIKCGKSEFYVKGERNKVRPLDYRVVAIDVSYGNDTAAPGARGTRDTAEALKAEIASEAVPPDAQAAAAQEAAQQCGRIGN